MSTTNKVSLTIDEVNSASTAGKQCGEILASTASNYATIGGVLVAAGIAIQAAHGLTDSDANGKRWKAWTTAYKGGIAAYYPERGETIMGVESIPGFGALPPMMSWVSFFLREGRRIEAAWGIRELRVAYDALKSADRAARAAKAEADAAPTAAEPEAPTVAATPAETSRVKLAARTSEKFTAVWETVLAAARDVTEITDDAARAAAADLLASCLTDAVAEYRKARTEAADAVREARVRKGKAK